MAKRKDVILLSIAEEFADQIYSGNKKYEFRKTPLARDLNYIALLENGTRNITGGFEVDEIIERPVEDLWEEIGKDFSKYDRFHNYYDGWGKGVAIKIGEIEKFDDPISLNYLTSLDSSFSVPNQFHFVYLTEKSIRALSKESGILDNYLPNSKGTTLDKFASEKAVLDDGSLNYRPMTENEIPIFRELFSKSPVPTEYEDINEDFINHIIESHKQGEDPYGYFTKSKKVYTLLEEDRVVGFTTTTWKRGGSVKYGPTILEKNIRGRGLGPKFRKLIDSRLRHEGVRKTYSTIPENLPHAIKYLIKSQYQIEAHLRQQYHEGHNELVFGKILHGGLPETIPEQQRSDSEKIEFSIGSDDFNNIDQFIISSADPWYDEIDESFVKSIQNAEDRGINAQFSKKGKRVFVGHKGSEVHCVAIASLKRGNAVKVSPVFSDIQGDGLREFWEYVETNIQEINKVRKIYTHIPTLDNTLSALFRQFGYIPEGLLREPYKQGIDLISYGKMVK